MRNSVDMGINNSHTIFMKTAISIPDDLFEAVNKLARENKTSRSQIFCSAVEDYLKKTKAVRMLDSLNEVYSDNEPTDEKLIRSRAKDYYWHNIIEKKKS